MNLLEERSRQLSATISAMTSTLQSDDVQAVLADLLALAASEDEAAKVRVRAREASLGVRLYGRERAELGASAPLSVKPTVGRVLYALTLALRPSLVVEFGTSLGCSTIYLASALRDVGGGSIISTELLAQKASRALENLVRAGLADLVEVRVGDALSTLADLDARVDLLFLDGSNDLYLPVLDMIAPRLSARALIVADMSKDEPHHDRYREYINTPERGYVSTELQLDAGLVVSAAPALSISLPGEQQNHA